MAYKQTREKHTIREVKIADTDASITYTLIRKKVKNINMRIKPDLRINVSAPTWVTNSEVDNFVLSNKEFIHRSYQKFQSRAAKKIESTPLHFVTGETMQILGNPVKLSVINAAKNSVVLDGDSIVIATKDVEDIERKSALVEKWLREQAYSLFAELTLDFYKKYFYDSYNFKCPSVKVRKMKSKWGSCMWRRGEITYSLNLYYQDMQFVEYVVAHELCHMVVPNHSKDFYRLMDEIMPDHKTRRKIPSLSNG